MAGLAGCPQQELGKEDAVVVVVQIMELHNLMLLRVRVSE